MTRRTTAVVAACAAVLALARPLEAAQITLLCSNGIKSVVDALLPTFEAASGHRVTVKYDLSANIKRQVEAGDAFDIALATPAIVDDLIKQGKVAADSRADIARVGLALMGRQGAPHIDASTIAQFTRALLDAKSIAYTRDSAAASAFNGVVSRLGVAEQVKAKSVLTDSAQATADAVTSGKAQYGVLPVSEILPVKGGEVLVTFPAGVQTYLEMKAATNARTSQRAAATELIRFLLSSSADAAMKRLGMERPHR